MAKLAVTLDSAKDRFTRARKAACSADRLSAALYDRLAADTLLAMIAADRGWNEGAARAKLLQIFEAIGLEDPWVSATRRRLSTVLFG